VQAQRKKTSARSGRPAKAGDIEAIRQAANDYIVSHYPFGCLGGTPRQLVLKHLDLWVVPVFLTSPGVGAVGEVGVVGVDGRTSKVVGGTNRQEVAEAIKHVKESKHDDLAAAFLRASTG
jgi:hypothetical protein